MACRYALVVGSDYRDGLELKSYFTRSFITSLVQPLLCPYVSDFFLSSFSFILHPPFLHPMAKASPLYVASARAMWGSASPLPVFPYPVAHALVQPWPDEKKRGRRSRCREVSSPSCRGMRGCGTGSRGERGGMTPLPRGFFQNLAVTCTSNVL